ncbi:MAG: hypothetical protein AAGB32_04780 [Pseudomonadota bacterium]
MAKKERTRGQKFLRFLLITFPIICIILGIVFVGALKMVERFPEPLKQGFEQYLSETTQTNASIEKIESFAFIPDVNISFKNLKLHDRSNAANISMQADHIAMQLPFWSVFFSGSNLKNIKIENMSSENGVLLPLAMDGVDLSIVEEEGPDQFGSFIKVTGLYGGQPLEAEVQIQKAEEGYKIPSDIPFSVKLGQSSLNGIIQKNIASIELKNAVFEKANQKAEAREFHLLKSGEYIINNPLSCLIIHGDSEECNQYSE